MSHSWSTYVTLHTFWADTLSRSSITRQLISWALQHAGVTCTTFGLRSDPCCMRVPMVNQKLLANENWFSTRWFSTSHGCGLCHSYGENRATTNIVMETRIYAANTYSQMSTASGFMKLNRRVGWLVGTWRVSVEIRTAPCTLTDSNVGTRFIHKTNEHNTCVIK